MSKSKIIQFESGKVKSKTTKPDKFKSDELLDKAYEAASNCVECGKCEKHCPQHIEIHKELKNAKRELEGPAYKIARKIAKLFLKY